MSKRYLLLAFFWACLTTTLWAQRPEGPGGPRPGGNMPAGSAILGMVMDQESGEPIEYATVSVFRQQDQKLVGGIVTKSDGRFMVGDLKAGTYYVEVKFMGYKKKTIKDLEIKGSPVRIGRVKLEMDAEVLDGVEVTAERQAMRYEIDKKIVDVSSQLTAKGGTAVDILENVPSVTVDIDGNVSLRGSTGFTVLIDGRPSVLDASEALQQIPASSIENIEIITNPSAKFDPDGTAGVLNIITKKNKLQGVSGMVNANAGSFGRYGGDFTVNVKREKVNFYVGGDYNNRVGPGSMYNERTTFGQDTTMLVSEGSSNFDMRMYSLKAGLDYQFTDKDIFTLGVRYGGREMQRSSDLDYTRTAGSLVEEYGSEDLTQWDGFFYSVDGGYTHKFAKKGHQLDAKFQYRSRDMTENANNFLTDMDGMTTSGQRSVEAGPSNSYRFNLDYTLPITDSHKFEAGYQARINGSQDVNEVYNYNTATQDYDFVDDWSYTTDFTRNIHSLYAMYGGKFGKLGMQAGLRAESTDREISLAGENESSHIGRWDFFPTLHLSYQASKSDQLMSSYSRRIQRSRSYFLEPFQTWQDAYNVRQGNPDLLPEYIDSFELGYLKYLGKHTLSVEGYYRVTHNKVERVQSVYEGLDDVFLHTFENVGQDYSLGGEIMLGLEIAPWWRTDLMANLYNYRVEGKLYEQSFDRQTFTWSSRFNNTFKIGKTTRLQFNASYNGPSVSAQGSREAFVMTSAAVKQDFMKGKLTATLQARDLFQTGKWVSYSEGEGFESYNERMRNAPNVSLTLSYRINNYKQKRGSRGGGDDMEMEM